jgi:integrase
MGVRFYLNTRNKKDRSEVGVILAAMRGKSIVRVVTSIRVKPSQWAPKDQRVRSTVPGATDINGALARLKADAERMLLDYPTDDALRDALRVRMGKHAAEAVPTVLEAFGRFKAHKAARYRPSTLQVYEALEDHLSGFVGTDATVAEIGPGWLDDFAGYLVGKGLQNTTTNKLLTRAKGFLRWLLDRGTISRLPSAKPLPVASNFALYLTPAELASLASISLADKPGGHQAARDLFVFAAVTGQRFADIQAMRWDDLHGDVWHLYVKKTNTTLHVPLASPALAIVERRRGEPRPLPRLSNQKANEYLKEVCREAKITAPVTVHRMKGGQRDSVTLPKHEAITTHSARKTFVTLALQSGLSMNELLGFTHQDLKSLKLYAGQDHSRLRRALHDVFDHLSQKPDEA